MMKTSAVSAAFVAVILAFLLGMPQVATAQGSGQDTLIVGVQNDTPNLHPWDVATNSVWKSFLWRQWVYEGLYGLSPDGTIYPVLASDLSVGPDPFNVTVTLRSGITFTDGVPLTADDVVFTFQTLGFNSQLSDTILKSIAWQDPPVFDRWNVSTAWGSTHDSHVGVIKVDATHIRFQLRQAYSMFYFGTLTTPIMPAHIWQNHLVPVNLAGGNFKVPGGVSLTTGNEFDLDKSFGSQSSDTQATIGTGPWYLVQWTPLTSAELKIYDGYWGKTQTLTWQGRQWPFFPVSLKTIQFKIFGTLDVAILALKTGDVHVVPWDLPIGFFNDLRRDSRMGFQISAADGFFYLAFNVRREPFSDINFRKAVAYAIDKDFIVDRLLAGFGIKGQAPISPINPAYINSSATTPPFDKTQAMAVLDAAGYTDQDGDGWRDLPDGRPMKYSILTPAKDYDPTRADAGIMIANNLKSIGLNIDSSPTAFDAIVSAAFVSASFDMFVLGWVNLGPFPELYLSEFFGCESDVLLGIGSNAGGYCSPQLEQKLTILDQEMNDAVRIQAAKDAEGILTNDLPYDTLYSKRWIEGYRQDIWGGWTAVNGEIFNAFSIGVLGATGTPTAPSGPLTISLNVPGIGVSGGTSDFYVYATQDGAPSSGVDVTITATTGETDSLTTDAGGYAKVTAFPLATVETPLDVVFVASGVKDTFTGGDTAFMRVVPPNDVAQLLLSSDTPVVAAGGTATITAKVANKLGTPIANVPLEVIPELVLGTVTPANVSTNALGVATFTYTAPPATLIPNRNQYDYVKASAFDPTKLALPETKVQTFVMGVENPTSDWYIVQIQTVTAYVVDADPVTPIPATSDVTVRVTKQDGTTVVAGEDVTITLSNSTALTPDAATKTTNGAGVVTFTMTANSPDAVPVTLDFSVNRAYSAMSGLSMFVTNATAQGNATFTTVSSRFVNPNTVFDITVTVYDQTGSPENGANVKMFVPYNDMGNPVLITDSNTWTFYGSVGTAFEAKTGAAGTVTTSISTKSFSADSLIRVETGVNGYGPLGAFMFGGAAGTYSNIDVVSKRNKLAAAESYSMAPVLMTPESRVANVTVKFSDINGPIVGGNISIYRGKGDLRPNKGATKIGWFLTDSNGEIKAMWVEPKNLIDTAMFYTAVVTSTDWALGGQVGSVPFEVCFPFLTPPAVLIANYEPTPTIVRVGDARTYTIKVKDFNGNPVQDATVKARLAGNVSTMTDGTGTANLNIVPPTSTATMTDVAELTFDLKKGIAEGTLQAGTLVGAGIFTLSSLQIPSSSVGQKVTVTATVTNTGPVRDMAQVVLSVDDQSFAVQEVWVDPNGGTATVSFSWVPYDTATHTLKLTVQASSVSGSTSAGDATMVIAGIGIVMLIVGVLVGYILGKRGKSKKPEEMPEAQMKPEEVKPEEPKT